MKKYIIGLVVLSFLIIPYVSFGQVEDVDPNPTASCISLQSSGLRYRARDTNTNEEVSLLQDFLQSKGYLNSEPTGYFGILTLKAVKDFQQANGISPTGYVGAITKEKIKVLTCWKDINPSSNNPTISSVSGPQTLNVGQQGTWTVNASSPNGGNLTYSVNWGENNPSCNGRLCETTQSFQSTQQSATFTHTYSKVATYTPVFTVTSENTIRCITTPCPSNAGTAQTSLSVKVSNTITTVPYISNVWSDLAGNATIQGTNLGTIGSNVSISMNGKIVSSGTSGYYVLFSNTVNFKPIDFGVTTSGNYSVQIINSSGVYSNIFTFYYTAPTVVTPTSPIIVLSPNGGEVWIRGENKSIKFEDYYSTSSTKLFTIELIPKNYTQNTAATYTITNNTTSSAHSTLPGLSYDWKVGSYLGGEVLNGEYKIRVCRMDYNNQASSGICDDGNSYFTISSSTGGGCLGGDIYSSATGQRCIGVNIPGVFGSSTYPPGCTSYRGYSSTNGLACNRSFPSGCNSFLGYSETTGLSCNN